MDLQLRGKNVLIAGGSKGIGLACAKAFLAEGATIAITSRSETNLANARSVLSSVFTTPADRVAEGLEAEAKLHGASVAEMFQRNIDRIALGRMAEPEEIANVTVFAASARASYLTGVVITMDGASSPIVV